MGFDEDGERTRLSLGKWKNHEENTLHGINPPSDDVPLAQLSTAIRAVQSDI